MKKEKLQTSIDLPPKLYLNGNINLMHYEVSRSNPEQFAVTGKTIKVGIYVLAEVLNVTSSTIVTRSTE